MPRGQVLVWGSTILERLCDECHCSRHLNLVKCVKPRGTKMRWTTLRRRLAKSNTPLLLAGLGLLAVSVTGAGLSLGGVSIKTLDSAGAQVAAGAFGLLLIAASFIVGVEPDASPGVDELADLLAAEVLRQWTRAAADRRLEVPAPIPVRWTKSRLPVAGPIREAVGSLRDPPRFSPLPGLDRVTGASLRSGQLRDLHRVYGGLQSGRLVIVGSPGSGKSGAAVLLLLDALRYRQQVSDGDRRSVPVPVLLTMRDWDPGAHRIESWLVSRMAQTYRLFAGRAGVADADALVHGGKISLFLDGLDEIPRHLRSAALRALTQQATFRVVVLTRSAEMVSAATEGHFVGAAALELMPVTPSAAADYLQRIQLEPPPTGWSELIRHLRGQPRGPIAKALSSPLTLTLIRDTYHHDDDVSELVDLASRMDDQLLAYEVEHHLLDRVLVAAYARRVGEPAPPYTLPVARQTLRYIATRMQDEATRDLAWWRIRLWAPRAPRMIALTLAVTTATGLMSGLTYVLVRTLFFGDQVTYVLSYWGVRFALGGAGVGLILGLLLARVDRLPKSLSLLRSRPMVSPSVLGIGLGIGLVIGLGIGLLFGFTRGLGYGLAASFGFTFLAALTATERPAESDRDPLNPLGLWRADRSYWRGFGLVFGIVFAVAVSLATTITEDIAGYGASIPVVLAIWVATGLAVGVVIGLVASACSSTSLAFLQLAHRQHTPVRLMRFLDDAHKRDVLRTVGPLYQFRHARLQDRLAGPEEDVPEAAPRTQSQTGSIASPSSPLQPTR